MKTKNKRKALSLVEILVSAVILAVTVMGLVSVFVSGRRYINRANKRSVAAALVTSFSRDFYRDVRADTWGSGRLRGGTHNLDQFNIDNINYDGEYTVSGVSGRDYREVTITFQYPDD
ncbi:MAG: type II secretion system GspH family protein [Candidatus Omnitrophica bacterium]|nr:type II secretion system GspH family protein [Candidatus Omnitrophota bacterium]